MVKKVWYNKGYHRVTVCKKSAVCSPGGATIQGVRALENHGFRAGVMEAVIAAYEKTVVMGKV